MKQRLQKLIAQAGLASRREAEQWIAAGRVTVNDQPASLGDGADPDQDLVRVDGALLGQGEKKVYLLLNKPVGYVTTLRDPQGRPTVTDLVKDIPARLFPIGRLDLNTEGLLLLTNDGDLAHRLAHPRHRVEKTYLVRVRGALSSQARHHLQKGVMLEDGLTAPARVEQVRSGGSHTWLQITIREGRNRQVRRMCEAVGYPVSRLKRLSIGFLDLGNLPAGKFRRLSSEEVVRLKKT
ncbi:MAG: pseudouridine synthase [Desulfuromonas sp.]|uniref:pseudouridine synthase n=1 Tax=Desulfuromonas sp. TaxID=892 RepID=UPI000CB9277C|nr:pseudouridine synthase [Desulfuromonas sp.]PLX84773.1 MAG: pseudouridine synthase [Desulfuromonas sp.]